MGHYSNKKKKFVRDARRMGDLPELSPGQLIISVEDNSILDDETIMPYINRSSKVPWIWEYNDGPGPIKTCPGTTDLAQLGVTIPLWADFRCRMSPDGGLECDLNVMKTSEEQTVGRIEPFTYDQTGSCPWTELRDKAISTANYLKIVSPFYFKTPRGYSTMIIGHPMYPRSEFAVVPGVVNTDSYHTMNVVLNVLTPKEFYVAQGYPIAQAIVFKRSDNPREIIEGDSSVHKLLKHRGFGGPWPPQWRKGKYKREQRRWDR